MGRRSSLLIERSWRKVCNPLLPAPQAGSHVSAGFKCVTRRLGYASLVANARKMRMAELFVGVDTGGTFTDLVLLQEGEIRVHKVLSTPNDPSQAILQGLSDLGVRENLSALVHGSTVATNAVLEHKGVRTGLITTAG